MADMAVLNVALETARDMFLGEVRFLLGVRGEVEAIERELKRMKVFLRVADAKKDEDEMLANRVEEVRELADEVQDVLETFVIKVSSQRSNGGIKNTLKRYACIFKECIALHTVGSDIVNIKTKLTNFTSSLQRYDVPKGESLDSAQVKRRWQRLSFPLPEKNFVGMEEDINKLVSHLVGEDKQQCQVVSICGMGGLGKTSLAKKVYHHNEVRRRFDGFAWACVTERCQPTKFLQEILSGLLSQNCNNLTDQDLVNELYKVQQEKKCLIIIDDIWSTDDWDCLKHAFQNTETRTSSKILLTSRNREVALHVDQNGFLHEPKGLSEEKGWELLQKIVFTGKDVGSEACEGFTIDQRMEDLGREMVRRCGGLPLAVVVLGGILVTKQSFKEWEVVLQNIKRYLSKGEGTGKEYGRGRGVSSLLDLSYNNLPYHLKPCFLYLANFPEDSDIEAERLYQLWLAERIISSDDRNEGETLMDVAEHYLGELAQRYMVQVCVEKTETTKRSFKSCRLHDLMRELCLAKVKDENFLIVIDSRVEKKECSTSSSSSNVIKTRRIAVHYNEEVGGYLDSLEKSRARYVRSLLFFGEYATKWVEENNINYFKLLNVLDIGEACMGGKNFPKALEKIMQQLRYFSLNGSQVVELPPSLGKLGYLETLDLQTHGELFIPNVLWKLKRLRHLYLPMSIKLLDSEKELKKLRLDSLNNLETLVNFHSRECEAKDLLKLNNLQKLQALFYKEREDLAHLVQAVTSTSSLLRQTDLKIFDYSFDTSEEELNVLVKLLGCHHLNNLELQGPGVTISKLPENYSLSSNLITLKLTESKLEDDPMPTLGKLPSLIHLEIGFDVFMGKEMVCSSTDFLQLQHLSIRFLPNLENMTVDQGAFLKLSYLSIWGCRKLKMIPDGITFLTALNQLDIYEMTQEFVDRLQVIDGKEGEDYHKIKHIPFIRIGSAISVSGSRSLSQAFLSFNLGLPEVDDDSRWNYIPHSPQ